jgi:peptidase M28-like protein
MSLETILQELSPAKAYAHIEHITSQIPSRLAGSANSQRMAEYAFETFQKAGLDARTHTFLGLVSFPETGLVRLLQPERREIAANTLGHSAVTDGVEGDLIYVGSGAESEYRGKDVRGKITLSELSYSPARHEKAYVAWKRGSIAQIMMNWGDETNEALPFGSMKSAWGNPTPETIETEMADIPCAGIARTEGLRLKALCAAGPVRAWVRTKAENGWKRLTMTSAELGTGTDRQFLLLGGHMDSWPGPQATDNAAGDACMMELARVFNLHRGELRRALVTGLWMGHETGTMISSSRFADVNWDRLRRRCVAYIQIDQPAMTGSSTWHQHSTDDIQNYVVGATREVVGEMPIHWRRQQKNGDSSFFGVGLPCAAGEMSFTDEEIARTALANLGWWHHSIHNTIDKVDRDLLALHLRVYARWIWGLLTEPILPYEYLPIATRFTDRLEELATLDIPDIDMRGAAQQAREFQELARSFDDLARRWRTRLGEGASDERPAELLNETMIRLSRILVPIASTVVGAYGQDRYGHAWQTQMIPSLVPYPRLAEFSRDSEDFQIWWVAMIRARNRVVDALSQAGGVVRSAIDGLGS